MVAAMAQEAAVPQRLKMSYEAYLNFASDANRIVEWVHGEALIYMPPSYQHQRMLSFFDEQLQAFIRFFNLGTLLLAPFEVKLWPDGPSREPDLLFISHDNLTKLTAKRFEGGPDLVIEIVSPTSVTEDRVYKFTEYERAGVREYWIIDSRPHQQQADFYVLGTEQIYQPAPVDDQGIYRSSVIPDFWLNLEWLWQDPLPDPQLCLAEIMLSIEGLPTEAKEAYQTLYNLLANKN